MAKTKTTTPKKINETKTIKTKVEDIVQDVKTEANKDVATFTIDKWHVLIAAVVVTVVALVVFL